MKPIEVFAVVIRTVGLIVCLMASAILSFALLTLVLGGPGNAGGIIVGVPILLMGLWLLRGASPLLAFAFPENEGAASSSTAKPAKHVVPEAK